jgi:hypothetical protein
MIPKYIDRTKQNKIMTIKEAAHYLQKSTSWVYKNWEILGGRKLGGSLFFPNKEDLYEYIFYKEERMEVRFHPKNDSIHRIRLQNKKRSQTGRSKEKRNIKRTDTSKGYGENPNRHGILRSG